MRNTFVATIFVFCIGSMWTQLQNVHDDFEGNGDISTWFGDDCTMDIAFSNPYIQGINTSSTVLKYMDVGGQYANIRFDVNENFDLSVNHTFTLKIYIESSSLSGSQNNQISLKLQDGTLGAPWETQSEIIKNVSLDQWQEVSFDFLNDPFINFNAGSSDPVLRTDFNRVLLQINGENNNDLVTAFIDDFDYDGNVGSCSPFNTLVWSDEFDGNGAIDNSKWFHQTFIPNGWGWYNGEVQHYTDREDNSYVQNGYMHIVAKQETYTDPVQGITKDYTSARLNSKFAFTYGRVEARAKLPNGVGTWPAIWMLGKNINETGAYWQTQGFGTTGWPECGEIDIMEHWGSNQNFVQSALHTPSSFGATVNHGGLMVNDVSNTFHTYAMEWSATEIVFSIDGLEYYTYSPNPQNMNTWPYIADQYILLNIAIENSIDPSFTQSDMVFDYIRVYQQGTGSTTIDTQAACDSYTWIDGNNYTSSNNSATFTLQNAQGCDSTVLLDLTIFNSSTGVDTQVACDSYTWIDGNAYTSSNNSATYTLQNTNGCDSTVVLNLTIFNSSTGVDTQVACDSYTWVDGNTYTANNNSATYTLQNTNGCDSTISLNLTINQSTNSELTETAIDSYTLNGITYDSSGTYIQTTTNSAGCDSTITLNLTIENSVGFSEHENDLLLFPNPSNDKIMVQVPSSFIGTEARVVDGSGKEVYKFIQDKYAVIIDCSRWPSGTYVILYKRGSDTRESRFIKL